MGYSSCLHKPCILSLACLAFSPIDCDHCEIIEEFYGESIGAEERDSLHWMEEKKNCLKENRWREVLQSLEPFLEDARVSDQDAPVRACHRYIENRPEFLDYEGALAANLPIGSGEIESAHRYVFQKRLKISGAWWTIDNLGKMVALRVTRVNQAWEDYWSGISQKPA